MKGLLCVLVYVYFIHTIDSASPLVDFVNKKDPGLPTWNLHNIIRGGDYDTFVVNLTSCLWLSPQDSNVYVWRHWLTIVVPHDLSPTEDLGAVYVDGGDNGASPPNQPDIPIGTIAVKAKIIAAHLNQVPNEPIYFTAEQPRKRRSEDGAIAYTWSHFLNDTSKPDWLLRNPMVKSVIKALDVMQLFAQDQGFPVPKRFGIAGASKRGWTTWLTPIDSRVVVIIPIVMPILNMGDVIRDLWRSLGEWSFALGDYLDMNIMSRLNTPEFNLMADVIDPIKYYDAIARVPKYLIIAAGDEFFLPDSPKRFWSQVPGVKHLRVVPNAEHSLAGQEAWIVDQLASFVAMFKTNTLIEPLDYTMVYSNTTASITVRPKTKPSSVTLYQASTWSSVRRDFRLVICGDLKNPDCFQPVFWLPTGLSPNSDGSYTASVDAPAQGWIGFLIEVEYISPTDPDIYVEVTSEVNIVPDRYPFPFPPFNGK